MKTSYSFHSNNLSFYVSGDNNIQLASDLLCQRYIQNRYIPPEDDWPPYHPKHYTPLTIIHHVGRRTETEVVTVAQETALKRSMLDNGKVVKSIDQLFTPLATILVMKQQMTLQLFYFIMLSYNSSV